MKRRDFIKGAGAVGAAGLIAGCATEENCAAPAENMAAAPAAEPEHEWKMVTTWPRDFPGLGTGANNLARWIGELTGGRITVKVYGGNELVPPFEVFDAVSRGTAEMGHGASYYWKGKSEATQFFAAVPFGMTAQEFNGWLYYGGGLELWREVYEPFNLVPFAVGNSGTQMGGWFKKEINGLDDLKGLKMRIPGLGGEVLKRAGGTPVTLPGAEIFTALQAGTIDATEWVSPYNDLAFGLYQAAQYYYYPGWHEPGANLEAIVNKEVFEGLSKELQTAVAMAARAACDDMLAEYTARNHKALKTLVEEHGVELRRFPDEVLERFKSLSADVLKEVAATDPLTQRVYDSYMGFMKGAVEYTAVAELAYMNARA